MKRLLKRLLVHLVTVSLLPTAVTALALSRPERAIAQGSSASGSQHTILLEADGVLEPGDSTLEDDNSFYDSYTFDGVEGQTISVVMESRYFDSQIQLQSPNGEIIAHNDDYDNIGVAFNAALIITLPQTGQFTVVANTSDPYARGQYSLRVVSVADEESEFAFSDIGLRQFEADQLNQRGVQHLRAEELQEALSLFEQALAIREDINDQFGKAGSLTVIGLAYEALEQYEQSLNYYEQALVLAIELSSREGEEVINTRLGTIHYSLNQYEQAIEFLENALSAAQSLNDRSSEGDALQGLGKAYLDFGNYPQALTHLEQALVIRQEIDDREGEGTTLGNIGLTYSYLGGYEAALAYYQQSLSILQEIGDRAKEGTLLNNIGEVYSSLGQYEEALFYYQQSLPIRQEMGDRRGEGITLNNIGNIYTYLGQYEEALAYYQQSLPISQETGNRRIEGTTLNNIGLVYSNLGEYEAALAHYQQSLPIRQEMGDRRGEGITLNNIGNISLYLGQYEEALTYYQQSLPISQEMGNPQIEGTVLSNIGFVYSNLGQYEEAISYYQQGLPISQEIGDRRQEGITLNNIGNIYFYLGQYEEALSYYQQSLPISQEIGNRRVEGTTLNNIGRLLERQDQPELAIIFLKASVSIFEAIRGDIRGLDIEVQQAFTDSISSIYRRLADLLLQQNRILEAQRVLDLLRVQELDEYLEDVRSNAQTESGIDYWQIERELLALYQQVLDDAAELRQLQSQSFDDLTAAEQDRLSELRDASVAVQEQFFAFRDRPEVVTAINLIRESTQGQNLELDSYAQLQDELQAMPQRTVVLYPLILDDRLELVLVFPDAPPLRFPVEVSSTELNQAIVEFGQQLTTRDANIEAIAQQLYTWLVEPMEETLTQQGVESIIYSPDGALRYIPLAALHDGEQYLAQRFSISHITADSLTDLAAPPRENQRLLAAACAECSFSFTVAESPYDFSDLPFTEIEVNNLGQQYPNASVLLNQDFSLSDLENRLGSYEVIHLATHAAFVSNVPQESFFVLGSGERISLQDIRRRWNLNHVGLIVLSACQTAVGSVELGSGIEFLGLGYQLQTAGAQSVIASLWQVSDGGTQVLMDAFYVALNNGYSKAEALQRAQQALITSDATVLEGDRGNATINIIDTRTGQPLEQSSDLSHPYYWSPFILIGNGL